MTTAQFSNELSTLLNSYSLKPKFGDNYARQDIILDEYEKFVFLSRAQDIVVKSYIERTFNQQGMGVDDSLSRQADLGFLSKVVAVNLSQNGGLDSRGYVGTFSDDVLCIAGEVCMVGGKQVAVKPLTYEEYGRLMSKPYQRPLKRQAWRLTHSAGSGVNSGLSVEIITHDGTPTYKARIVRHPHPIASSEVSAMFTSGGECELPESMHTEVLTKAVELVLISRGIVPQKTDGGQGR